MATRKLVVGNWKMYVGSTEEAKRLARSTRSAVRPLKNIEAVVCPPFPFMHAAMFRIPSGNFSAGAQSASFFDEGPHTGQVSAGMLASMKAKYAIVGHSEERSLGDTDAAVSKRLGQVLEAGLTAIACVGEHAREEGGAHLDFLKNQIQATFAGVPAEKAKRIVIAYEPVWAIGAKEAMAPEDIHQTSIFIRKVFSDLFGQEIGMKAKILYGGAVNFRNAREIMQLGRVDGLLVGRESVNMPGFVELLKAVNET